jgi:hypothetical protein
MITMAHQSQRFILRLTSFVFVLLWCKGLSAQNVNPISTVFSIGSVGTIGSATPNFSGPVVIDAAACIQLSSGLSTYNATTAGLFVSSCIVPAFTNSPLKLICYPNPVTTTVWVKTAEPVVEKSATVSLALIGADGKTVGAYNTSLAQLNAGFAINVANKAAGVYYIRYRSITQTGELKIIKVN